jgi:hypothetical protein
MCNIKIKLMLRLFQENKSYGVKTIALILCLHVAVHNIPNTNNVVSLILLHVHRSKNEIHKPTHIFLDKNG